jgi:hypothetical protein
MGFKQVDLVYPGSSGPTAISPTSKEGSVKIFQLSRTDTTASLKAVLPADSTILGFLIYGAASNAGTTATISIGSTLASSNEFVNAQDIKTTGGLVIPTATINSANMPQLENYPLGADIQIFAKYAETGGASTLGGPYKIVIWFVR